MQKIKREDEQNTILDADSCASTAYGSAHEIFNQTMDKIQDRVRDEKRTN